MIGATLPGIPAVLAGRNAHLGWGLTTTFADDQDLVMEALNPQNAEEYLTAEGPKPFTTRRAIITVKDAAPITLMLRWSQNGPILPGSHFNLADVTPRGHVAALDGVGDYTRPQQTYHILISLPWVPPSSLSWWYHIP